MLVHRVPRIARKVVVVCLAVAVSLVVALAVAFEPTALAARDVPGTSGPLVARVVDRDAHATMDEAPRSKLATEPLTLRDGDATVLGFPLAARAARASGASGASGAATDARGITVVYLHGIHGLPANGCPWLRDGATELGWLVCPEANRRLANGTFSWAGPVAAEYAVVARAERIARANGADADANANANDADVLVGFSQGAYVALDLVQARLGRHRGLVLIGADVEGAVSRAMLETAGVSRIVLSAGDLDAASAPMKRAVDRLLREGMDARYVSLGPIGHSYATPEKEALRDAIVWSGTSPPSS